MPGKWMFPFLHKTDAPKGQKSVTQEEIDFALNFVNTVSTLEAMLHSGDDPEKIATQTLKTACEFYHADWCGFLEVDLDLGLWTPHWWHNTSPNDKTMVLLNEFESASGLPRWVTAMRENTAIVVRDAEEIRTEYPEEYGVYTRLGAQSVLAVPVKPRPVGFLVVRNPKRFGHDSRMMSVLAYVVLNAINQHAYMESAKMVLTPDSIQSDKDIIINFFGNMEIMTSKGILREQDFKSPKSSRVITYLMLHRKAAHTPMEIAEALWPDDTYDPDAIGSNIRGFIYRFRQTFSLVSDHQLIQSTPNGYRINPDLRIMTDLQQFDKLWDAAQKPIDREHKVEMLKQAYMLYKGHIFENACDEPWIVSLVNRHSLRYVGIVNELLAELAAIKDYPCLQAYAAHSLELVPGNMRAYYWQIFSMYQMGAVEMAKSEISRAENDLTGDEYAMLVRLLKSNPELPPKELYDEHFAV